MDRKLAERYRQTRKSCSVFRVVRAKRWVQNLPLVWGVFGVRVLLLLLLLPRSVVPLVSRSSSSLFHVFHLWVQKKSLYFSCCSFSMFSIFAAARRFRVAALASRFMLPTSLTFKTETKPRVFTFLQLQTQENHMSFSPSPDVTICQRCARLVLKNCGHRALHNSTPTSSSAIRLVLQGTKNVIDLMRS